MILDRIGTILIAGLIIYWLWLVVPPFLRGLVAFFTLPDHFNKWRRDEYYYYDQWKREERAREKEARS